MEIDIVLLRPQNLYLCPGDDAGAHITTNSAQCPCGERNLVSLAQILDRPEPESIVEYDGICSSLPTIQRLFHE